MNRRIVRPPRLAAIWLRLAAPARLRDAIVAEVDAAFRRDLGSRGRAAARRRYRREAFSPALLGLRWQLCRVGSSNSPRPGRPRHRAARPGVTGMLDALLQDIRFSLRALAARPGFSLLAIAILAVGIGSTTTIYTFVDNVLLRGLPYPQAERLVYFDDGNHPNPRFLAWQENADSFDGLASVLGTQIDLIGDGEPARIGVGLVSPEFFRLFGATPALGRLFEHDDFETARSVVLSHGAWVQRWGGDPGIVGRSLRLGGESARVVGVLAEGFRAPELLVGTRTEAWMPYGPTSRGYDSPGTYALSVAGRLREDVSLPAAQAELDALAVQLADQDPEHYRNADGSVVHFPLRPFLDATVGSVSGTLWMLLGAAGLMLVLSCANVANLLLARGTDRGRELALRSAIGAGRGRVLSQLLTESVLLAIVAGVAGLALALLGVRGLERIAVDLPRAATVELDLRVLLLALGASASTGIFFGMLPALQALRGDMTEVLRDGARGATDGADRGRTRGLLVAAEVAIAVVLAVAAGLIVNSFLRLNRIDPGFTPEGAFAFTVDMDRVEVEQRPLLLDSIRRQVASIPGVDGVGSGVTIPFQITGGGRCCWFDRIQVERDAGYSEEDFSTVVIQVAPGYFDALDARLLHGRAIAAGDDFDTPAAVVTASAARRFFGEENVVGRMIDIDNTFQMPIVGVVEDILHWGPDQPTDRMIYVPFDAYPEWLPSMTVVVRSDRRDAGLAAELRDAVWTVVPELPLDSLVTLEEMVAGSRSRTRFITLLLGGFAALGLAVAAAGIYGSLLYSVTRRSQEIGIRLALGARPRGVTGLVVGQAAVQIGAGLALGLLAAFAASRVMEGLLFEVAPTDPATYLAVAAALGTVALVAAWLPARRASRTDPVTTLRAD